MEELDWSVGKIIAAVEEEGISGQTLVFFISDNGPWLAYDIEGGSAGPLRDGKGTTFEISMAPRVAITLSAPC